MQVNNIPLEQDRNDQARVDALSRLIALLERDQPHPRPVKAKDNPLSMLARLQLAHAAYALANTGEMERASLGAFFRHRSLPE
ncbi:MAG: hypothetical protein RMJ43_10930 [Chloroherpetonaceae bacterium]|nr:hypothetical protein [Chthonomonadaceae bacterium]MDW8208342.1 hypothetical protein [Chloroherpetonaceae bacterium]